MLGKLLFISKTGFLVSITMIVIGLSFGYNIIWGIIIGLFLIVLAFLFFNKIGNLPCVKMQLLLESHNFENIAVLNQLDDRISYYEVALEYTDLMSQCLNIKDEDFNSVSNFTIKLFNEVEKENIHELITIMNSHKPLSDNFLSLGNALKQINIKKEICNSNVENYVRTYFDFVEMYKLILYQLADVVNVIVKKKINKENWAAIYDLFKEYDKDSLEFLWNKKVFIIRNSRAHKGSWKVNQKKEIMVFKDKTKKAEYTYEEFNELLKYSIKWFIAYLHGLSIVNLTYHKKIGDNMGKEG